MTHVVSYFSGVGQTFHRKNTIFHFAVFVLFAFTASQATLQLSLYRSITCDRPTSDFQLVRLQAWGPLHLAPMTTSQHPEKGTLSPCKYPVSLDHQSFLPMVYQSVEPMGLGLA